MPPFPQWSSHQSLSTKGGLKCCISSVQDQTQTTTWLPLLCLPSTVKINANFHQSVELLFLGLKRVGEGRLGQRRKGLITFNLFTWRVITSGLNYSLRARIRNNIKPQFWLAWKQWANCYPIPPHCEAFWFWLTVDRKDHVNQSINCFPVTFLVYCAHVIAVSLFGCMFWIKI